MTVIDVNTGRYTGDDSLEQTVYHTNLFSGGRDCKEVKLRDIGGIIVVDFIDMSSASRTTARLLKNSKKVSFGGRTATLGRCGIGCDYKNHPIKPKHKKRLPPNHFCQLYFFKTNFTNLKFFLKLKLNQISPPNLKTEKDGSLT